MEKPSASVPSFALVLSQDCMGRGDDALGALLMKKFLKTFTDIAPTPTHVLLYNSGVKLAAEGSEVLAELGALGQKGAQVLCCGTCVDHFALRDRMRAGHISNMHEIVGAMASAGRLVAP